MTTAADDPAVEDAFEALLAGRPVPERAAGTFDGVAAFTEAVRGTATAPGRPNAALADLLATGLLDQSSPSTRTARSAGPSPSRRARVRKRSRYAMFFPALLAKILSAGAVAQAATGAGIVLVAVTGAGAAGVLPGPVQDTFTSIVSDETPQEPPVEEAPTAEVPATDVTAVEVTPVEETPVAEATAEDAELTPAEQWAQDGPEPGQPFGEWVSEGARNGWATGQIVSEWAKRKGETVEVETPEAESTTGADETPEVGDGTDDAPEVEQSSEDAGGHGRGDSGDRGNGNGRD